MPSCLASMLVLTQSLMRRHCCAACSAARKTRSVTGTSPPLSKNAGGGALARQPHWTEAAAVGDEQWIQELADGFPSSWRRIEHVLGDAELRGDVAEEPATYIVRVSKRRREGLLRTFGRRP